MTNADTKAFWAAMGVPEPELPTYDDAGVDLTVIRWMLSMSPLERLEHLQGAIDSIREMRRDIDKDRLRESVIGPRPPPR